MVKVCYNMHAYRSHQDSLTLIRVSTLKRKCYDVATSIKRLTVIRFMPLFLCKITIYCTNQSNLLIYKPHIQYLYK